MVEIIRPHYLSGRSASEETRPLRRNRDFMLLWSGQAVSAACTRVSTLALPLLALALTGSPAQAGLLAAARLLPYLGLSLPAGALIDRRERKRVMMCCDAARGLALGSIPLAAVAGRLGLAQLYAVVLIEGTAFVFFSIAELACLPRVVPEAQRTRAYALNSAADSLAEIVGPGLGGAIVGAARTVSAGAALAYLVDSLSYIVSLVSLAFIRTPFQAERVPVAARSLRAEIAEGLRFLWRQRHLRVLALLAMSVSLLGTPLDLAIVVLARQALHADARAIGLIFSGGSVGGLLGSLIAPRIATRLRNGRVIVGSLAAWALAIPLLAVAGTPLLLGLGAVLVFALFPFYGITAGAYRLTLIPDALQGRVNGVFRLLGSGADPLGTIAAGLLLGALGPRPVLWLVAGIVGLSAAAAARTSLRTA